MKLTNECSLMNIKNIEIEITEYTTLEELSDEEQELIRQAIEATRRSYAPYSGFRVGAAVRLADGTIVTGTNQENAAYPSGLCAERTTLFYANSQHPDQAVVTMAIAACNSNGLTEIPVSPCGACRQVMLECETRYRQPIRILLYGTRKIDCIKRAGDLLPFSFTEENLK